MSLDVDQISAELAARGLRLTRQRRAVLDAVAADLLERQPSAGLRRRP